MFLSYASIRRPVAMCCLIIALFLLGLNGYRKMSLEWLPKVDMPYITVVTIYPGGSPAEIETDIAKRMEDVIASVDGLKNMTSVCMENVCQMLIEFDLHIDVDVAANDVREKIDLIVNDFPQGTEKPKVLKFDINAIPILTMALTGDAPMDDLYDYADNELKDRLTTITGVAEIQLIGGAEREVHVALDRRKLAARGLSSMDIVQAVQQGVRVVPSGRVREAGAEYAVKFDADYKDFHEIGTLEVAQEEDSRCLIRDVGHVEMATEELREAAYVDGRPCIAIKVVKRADANAVRVVEQVKEAVAALRGQLPGGMELVWITDDGSFVRSSVDDTLKNIGQGIVLTALILFLFLYNLRSTFIVTITMPLTVIIGFFFLGFLDYSLNACTLMAIGLSVGILVTNSIVVLESITKRFAKSGDAKEAARLGAREVAIAVAASAGTNLVVLFPVATMGTQVGLFFGPFAITMVIMTLVSLFISFSLTPILCSKLLKPPKPGRSPLRWMERQWNRMFDVVTKFFVGTLRFFEKRRWAAILFLVLIGIVFYWSLGIAGEVGFDFFPHLDKGEIYVKLEYPTRSDLGQTTARVREVEDRLRGLPELKHMLTTVGRVEGSVGRSSEGPYLAQLLLRFPDKDVRKHPMEDILHRVHKALEGYPNCIVSVGQPSGMGGQSTPVELFIAGDEFEELDRLALKVKSFAEEIDGFVDPDTTVRTGKPELRVLPRRAVLADLGIPAVGMGLALRANLEGIDSGVYKEGGRNYDIVVKMEEEPGKQQVQDFLLPGAPGHPLVLTTLAEVKEGRAPIQITRRNKQRISKLFADVDGPIGTLVGQLLERVDDEKILGPGYSYGFVGDYERMQETIAAMAEVGIIAIILVYLVLAAILESFRQPIIILLTLPLGLIGMLWALGIAGVAINMFVMLGAVMLIGIVVNNAILIMDRLNQYVAKGVGRHESMVRAAGDRFRAIVMITLAAVLGMLPMALGRGIGSELRTAIGTASVGGIAVSAALTLIVLPILYDLMTRGAAEKH